jgi:UDP-3-O-[3-hydroxymyristoyl] glucosamine N-acyltransferase
MAAIGVLYPGVGIGVGVRVGKGVGLGGGVGVRGGVRGANVAIRPRAMLNTTSRLRIHRTR